MTQTLRVTPEAEADLTDAADWYEKRQAGLGADFLHAVVDAYERLLENPRRAGPVPGVPEASGMRRVRVHRFPYAVVFIEHDDVIRVIAVAHAHRRPGYWRTR